MTSEPRLESKMETDNQKHESQKPADNIADNNSADKPKKKITGIVITLIIMIIMAVSIVYYLINATVESEITTTVPKQNTVTSKVEVQKNISFQQYIDNPYQMEGQKAELKGYLEKYVRWDHNAGVYVEAVSDDYGNKIDVIEIEPKMKPMFPKTGKTDGVYLVEGVFVRKYTTLLIKAESISASEKEIEILENTEIITESEQIKEKKVMPKYPNARKFLLGIIWREA